ncbi:MAG: hypothetical protein LH624_10415, partial [Cryobacterium sp.]|nr:hypothetical protein [Cryobacterium sp.]
MTLSYDRVTACDYLREQVSDVTIHSWDLARATDADESLHSALVEAVWTVFEPQRDTLEASGLSGFVRSECAAPIPAARPDRPGRAPALVGTGARPRP